MDSFRQILRVGYLYANGVKQAKIAQQLGFSTAKVSRLLHQSRNYMQIIYNIPRELFLENKLIRHFHLLDAIVVETVTSEMTNTIVGQYAARYFDEHVENESSIALSCGETLLEMIEALPRRRDKCLNIIQMSIESDPENMYISPATLASVLRFKTNSSSKIIGFQMPPPRISSVEEQLRFEVSSSEQFKLLKEAAKSANYIFVGIGNPSPDGSINQRLLRTIGVKDPVEFREFIEQNNIVAELNNQLLDIDGKDKTYDLPNIANRVVTVLTLDELREICTKIPEDRNLFSKRQRVIGVAAGNNKAAAIHAVLKARIVNVIITSKETAEQILNQASTDNSI